MKVMALAAHVICIAFCTLALAGETPSNQWVKVAEDQVGPRVSAALVHDAQHKSFLLLSGHIQHDIKGEFPYDIQAFDVATARWTNVLPDAARGRGDVTGNVKNPGFIKTGDKAVMPDADGVLRLNPQSTKFYNQYAYAPWDGCVYALVRGFTVKYDPQKKMWVELNPTQTPAPQAGSWKSTLCWSALCADPVNKEIVLFGGCGVRTENASPGTWVYSTEKNEWRKLDLKIQPPHRALSPMAFDVKSKKIVLFGGERLDQLYSDTWVYDCPLRTWEERKPELSPSPRFGHGLIFLSKSKTIAVLGGKTYTSSTSYCAMLYKPLPFEMWTYDVTQNKWSLLKSTTAPSQTPNSTMMAAVNENDEVIVVRETQGKIPDETWLCRIDPSLTDSATTEKSGVKPGTLTFRTESFDPEWYTKDVPPADPSVMTNFFKNLPSNSFVTITAPKWPQCHSPADWSTVALDTDLDQILHIGGGHSAYFGNDVAHFDLVKGRWTISYRPQFALEFNYDLSGPGSMAFNNSPWGAHNYKAYGYDATRKRMMVVKYETMFYDAEKREWPFMEQFETKTFVGSKYITYLCPTPHGMYVWGKANENARSGSVYKLEDGTSWVQVKTIGDAVPNPECDRSTIVYDANKDRFLVTTAPARNATEPFGQIWSVDRKSGTVQKLNPTGMNKFANKRMAREAVYFPKCNVVLFGMLIKSDEQLLVPLYDVEKNAWFLADFPGSEILNGNKKAEGANVSMGLVYDPKRDCAYAIHGSLRNGSLRALRLDMATLTKINLK